MPSTPTEDPRSMQGDLLSPCRRWRNARKLRETTCAQPTRCVALLVAPCWSPRTSPARVNGQPSLAKFEEVGLVERCYDGRMVPHDVGKKIPVPQVAKGNEEQQSWVTADLMSVAEVPVLGHDDPTVRIGERSDLRVRGLAAPWKVLDVHRVVAEFTHLPLERARQLRVNEKPHRDRREPFRRRTTGASLRP